jgi:hypothetical protein
VFLKESKARFTEEVDVTQPLLKGIAAKVCDLHLWHIGDAPFFIEP